MRYAIYFTPDADHPLSLRAAQWLGRDCHGNALVEQPHIYPIMGEELTELTQEPRRYGFHATLKPPFRLVEGTRPEDLVSAMRTFSQGETAIELPPLVINTIGPFFALTLARPSAELAALSDRVVQAFEPFRAALDDNEIARRKPDSLTERQRTYLVKWGYPYVMEEFRFHMTLTGPVAQEQQSAVREMLLDWFSPVLGEPVRLNSLALFVEPASGEPFRVEEEIILHAGRHAISA